MKVFKDNEDNEALVRDWFTRALNQAALDSMKFLVENEKDILKKIAKDKKDFLWTDNAIKDTTHFQIYQYLQDEKIINSSLGIISLHIQEIGESVNIFTLLTNKGLDIVGYIDKELDKFDQFVDKSILNLYNSLASQEPSDAIKYIGVSLNILLAEGGASLFFQNNNLMVFYQKIVTKIHQDLNLDNKNNLDTKLETLCNLARSRYSQNIQIMNNLNKIFIHLYEELSASYLKQNNALAEKYAREACHLADKNDPILANIYFNLATSIGHYDTNKALEYYQSSYECFLKQQGQRDVKKDLIDIKSNMLSIISQLGDNESYGSILSELEQLGASKEKILYYKSCAPKSSTISISKFKLPDNFVNLSLEKKLQYILPQAFQLYQQKNYNQAHKAYQKALELYKSDKSPDPMNIQVLQECLINNFIANNKLKEAFEFLEKEIPKESWRNSDISMKMRYYIIILNQKSGFYELSANLLIDFYKQEKYGSAEHYLFQNAFDLLIMNLIILKQPDILQKLYDSLPQLFYQFQEKYLSNKKDAEKLESKFDELVLEDVDNIVSDQQNLLNSYDKNHENILEINDEFNLDEFQKQMLGQHQYFLGLKDQLMQRNPEEIIASVKWCIGDELYDKNADDIYYHQHNHAHYYAMIDRKLKLKLAEQSGFFEKALSKGFVSGSHGSNGLKIISGKCIELKINANKRLLADKVYKNNNGDRLVIFNIQSNHDNNSISQLKMHVINVSSNSSEDNFTDHYPGFYADGVFDQGPQQANVSELAGESLDSDTGS